MSETNSVGAASGAAAGAAHALLFTDLVDSTATAQRVGDAHAAQLWAEHDRCARDLLRVHRGREIDRSDGFFLLFDTAVDAAGYALAYHRAVGDLGLAARVGVHVGAVTLRPNTADDIARGAKALEVEGLAKPHAARIMALARGGQTLLSAEARRALGAATLDGAEFESHGHYRLKGVDEPVEVIELGQPGHAGFAPPADADKAYRVVRRDDLWHPLREVRHNLPAERDAFVGRSTELRTLAQRLDAGARLLTVLGPGGTGKTRFVARYGRVWLGDWPGGIHFCDLSEARSFDGVVSAVAAALGVPLGRADPVVQLGHAIAGRGRCLVILDNFEQIVEHAPATLARWLDRAGDAAFIVTSRERLHLAGEEIFPIDPLPLADDAIALFVARARAQRPGFALTAVNRPAIAEVVRLLDGLPLAIELAAARVGVLSPVQLVERMRDRFHLLAGARGAAARQATLRAAIDWSWELLTPWEQAALAQCSVFEGGFTLDSAEAVIDLTPWPHAPAPMDAVMALVDKSLLRSRYTLAGGPRLDIDEPYFAMYLSIHEYASARLAAQGPDAMRAAQTRHGEHYGRFGEPAALRLLWLSDGTERHRRLTLELDNLVAACRRALQRGHAAVAVATYRATWEVLELRGPFALGETLGAQIASLVGIGADAQAQLDLTRARVSWRAGRTREAEPWLLRTLDQARASGQRALEGDAALLLGNLHHAQGRNDEAYAQLWASLAIHREIGDRVGEGQVQGNLGSVLNDQGRLDEAMTCYLTSLAIHREVGNRRDEGGVLNNLGSLHTDRGETDEALARYEQALLIHRELGNRRAEALVLSNIGVSHHDQRRFDDARATYERALVLHREVGARSMEGVVLSNLGNLLREQGLLAQARTNYDQALVILRESDHRRFEGCVLGSLADLLIMQGDVVQARIALASGEPLLREAGDTLELAKLLCVRGRAEVLEGGRAAALASLAEARAHAAAMGVGRDSELQHEIDKLDRALAGR